MPGTYGSYTVIDIENLRLGPNQARAINWNNYAGGNTGNRLFSNPLTYISAYGPFNTNGTLSSLNNVWEPAPPDPSGNINPPSAITTNKSTLD